VHWLDTIPNLLESEVQHLRDGTDPEFLRGSRGLSCDALEEMQRLLNFCADRHIMLIGYLSSYHPRFYAALRSEPRQDYLWRVAPVLAPLFQKAGASFFDLQDPSAIGCQGGEYLDAVHESEVCMAKALLVMASRDSRSRSLFDTGKLEGFLSHRRSEWQLGF